MERSYNAEVREEREKGGLMNMELGTGKFVVVKF
jgi:hypothetical protein